MRKIIYSLVIIVMLLLPLLSACETAETSSPPVTTTPKPTVTPTQTSTPRVDWWEEKWGEPKYGGSIIIRSTGLGSMNFDPIRLGCGPWLEDLTGYDYTIDPEVCSFVYTFTPLEYRTGLLAESWEVENYDTFTFHIREGVSFQDVPPVNGREMTAYDVEYSYHRALGLGSGFTEANPFASSGQRLLESVTATDKYTVVFKFKQPSIENIFTIVDSGVTTAVIAKEAVEEWGDLSEWQHAIGTGPFILTDHVSGTSLTYVKNTNYWGYDRRYPENELPYADEIKELIIPDLATAIAALRTGKIDQLESLSNLQANSLMESNPELEQISVLQNVTPIDLKFGAEPFYPDIRVRKALQMSIDLPTIAQAHYGETGNPTPFGLLGESVKGYYTPFDEWPEDVKEGYTYDPEKARQLLAEAGYPDGFQTKCIASTAEDVEILEIVKAYFADINVDMEIETMDRSTWTALANAGTYDQLAFGYPSMACNDPINRNMSRRYSTGGFNYSHVNDPVYDDLYDQYYACIDLEEQQRLVREANDYAVSQHWSIFLPVKSLITVYHPWLKGYTGQILWLTRDGRWLSTYWVDQDLKESMGY